MQLKVTLLGTGSSSGVPEIGCKCLVCISNNPRNKRLRVSVLVEAQGKHILIDTSPDFRQQALTNGITKLDAVLYTHDHADHIHGIDDLRAFNVMSNTALPVYADPRTLANLQQRFPYVFRSKPERAWYRPSLEPHEIPSNPLSEIDIAGVRVTPFWQNHADIQSLGYRFGNFAYSTDVNGFPEESFAMLEGLDVWVVDCLRQKPSYTHSRLEMTLEWIERLKPKRAILTHMAHEMDYDTLARELPPGVEPGYDGLVVEIS
jgi:phosphoribosyl 1,2-cyclic phosphate phosphodiesterase